MPRKANHLYKAGAKGREEAAFEKRYGAKKGKKVYGATVGRVKRERQRKYGSR